MEVEEQADFYADQEPRDNIFERSSDDGDDDGEGESVIHYHLPDPQVVRAYARDVQSAKAQRRCTSGLAAVGDLKWHLDQLSGHSREFVAWCNAAAGTLLNGVKILPRNGPYYPVARPDVVYLYFKEYLQHRGKLKAGRRRDGAFERECDGEMTSPASMLVQQRNSLQQLQDAQRNWEVTRARARRAAARADWRRSILGTLRWKIFVALSKAFSD